MTPSHPPAGWLQIKINSQLSHYMKLSRSALDALNSKLASENEVLTLALGDAVNGNVKWLGNSRTYSIGISRPTDAAGGIAIVREAGMTSAFYFEKYARETLAHIACLVTGTDTEHNTELMRRRSAIEAAQAYVNEMQSATLVSIHDPRYAPMPHLAHLP